MNKKLKVYLWDAANTLFPEKWQHPKFATYEDFLLSKFPDGHYNNLEKEKACARAYQKEYYLVWPGQGFKELLSWTRNNFVVTSGTIDQVAIRREKILKSHQLDINQYLKGTLTSFAYHDNPTENAKDEEFWQRMLKEKYEEGNREVIYTDDKLAGVQDFCSAAKKLNLVDLIIRGYHINNNDSGLRKVGEHWEVGNLLDILEKEKSLE